MSSKTVFERIIERQVKQEAKRWFEMEGMHDIGVRDLVLEEGDEFALYYSVAVIYWTEDETMESAVLRFRVNHYGAYVIHEKRSDGKEGC